MYLFNNDSYYYEHVGEDQVILYNDIVVICFPSNDISDNPKYDVCEHLQQLV